MFINKPELSGAVYPKWWDTGVIDKKCGRSGDPSTSEMIGILIPRDLEYPIPHS